MSTPEIDISKLDKPEVLAALYNNSKQQGMGFLNPRGRELLTKEQAADPRVQPGQFGPAGQELPDAGSDVRVRGLLQRGGVLGCPASSTRSLGR